MRRVSSHEPGKTVDGIDKVQDPHADDGADREWLLCTVGRIMVDTIMTIRCYWLEAGEDSKTGMSISVS